MLKITDSFIARKLNWKLYCCGVENMYKDFKILNRTCYGDNFEYEDLEYDIDGTNVKTSYYDPDVFLSHDFEFLKPKKERNEWRTDHILEIIIEGDIEKTLDKIALATGFQLEYR